jgi:hypothetical protein
LPPPTESPFALRVLYFSPGADLSDFRKPIQRNGGFRLQVAGRGHFTKLTFLTVQRRQPQISLSCPDRLMRLHLPQIRDRPNQLHHRSGSIFRSLNNYVVSHRGGRRQHTTSGLKFQGGFWHRPRVTVGTGQTFWVVIADREAGDN